MKIAIKPENLIERIALIFNLAPLPLIETQVYFNVARIIMAGASLGIFEAVGKSSKTLAQIAEECKTNEDATKQLLNALVGIGYLKWKDKNYSLRPKYYKWLLKESPSNLIGKLRFQESEWNWMAKLEDYIRTGQPMDLHSSMNADEWVQYQEGMRDLSVNVAKELAGKIPIASNATKMLDIGGSHGLFSIELCKKHPSLSSTILELSGAVDQASAIAARYGLTDRVKYRVGNALKDDLGENEYDLIMINNLVHHFTLVENRILATKIARALKPGGIYAIGEFIRAQTPGEGDVVSATLDLYFSLTSFSGTWSTSQMQDWQKNAGLIPAKTISLMSLPGWRMVVALKK